MTINALIFLSSERCDKWLIISEDWRKRAGVDFFVSQEQIYRPQPSHTKMNLDFVEFEKLGWGGPLRYQSYANSVILACPEAPLDKIMEIIQLKDLKEIKEKISKLELEPAAMKAVRDIIRKERNVVSAMASRAKKKALRLELVSQLERHKQRKEELKQARQELQAKRVYWEKLYRNLFEKLAPEDQLLWELLQESGERKL